MYANEKIFLKIFYTIWYNLEKSRFDSEKRWYNFFAFWSTNILSNKILRYRNQTNCRCCDCEITAKTFIDILLLTHQRHLKLSLHMLLKFMVKILINSIKNNVININLCDIYILSVFHINKIPLATPLINHCIINMHQVYHTKHKVPT